VFRQVEPEETPSSVVLTDRPDSDKATRYASKHREPMLPQQRLKVLYDLSGRLTSLRDTAALLGDAMDICFQMFQFERGAIGIRRPERRNVEWPVVRNATGAEGELTISRTIVARALDKGERSVLVDTDMATIDPTVSMVQHGIRSALCVPLEYQGQILGVIYGDRTTSGAVYTDEDMDFLAGLARQVSIGLVNSRLLEAETLKVQLENEIALARDIQKRLFPARLPDDEHLRVAALNDPGRHVSGDYYDVLLLPDGRLGVLVADVTGKGVASSLLMANLQAAVRVTLDPSRDLSDLMRQWNALVYHNTDPGKFVTCLLMVVDPARRTVSFASAGHFMPVVITGDRSGCHELDCERGLPLGIDSKEQYGAATCDLGPLPCTVFAYTDGVVEAMNAREELFDWPRTMDALHDEPDLDPARMIRRVRSAITTFCGSVPQSDDITMVAVHLP
jgi:serine phosphatase RsbU (regulator of sigma subunit)